MTDRDRETDILSNEQIHDGPSAVDDMPFEDRQSGAEWMARVRSQFPDAELDWDELETVGADRETVVSRLADATGMTEDAVSEELRAAGNDWEM